MGFGTRLATVFAMKFSVAAILMSLGCLAVAQVQMSKSGATVKQTWPLGQAVRYELVSKAEMGPGQPFATRTPISLTATKATAAVTELSVLFGIRKQKLSAAPATVARVSPDAFPFGPIVFSSKPVALGAGWVQAATYPGMREGQKLRWKFVGRAKLNGVAVSEFRGEFQAESKRAAVVGRGTLLLDDANGLIRSWSWEEEMTSFATTSVYSGTSSRRSFSLVRAR